MKSKHIRYIFLGLAFLFTMISCKNPPPVYQEELPSGTAAVDREFTSPGKADLDELEAAAARAETARQQVLDMDCPSIFPRDWESADSLYHQAQKQEKTSTLRETQESTVRYYAIADIFDALNRKTLIVLSEDKNEELAHARAEASKYIAGKIKAAEAAAAENVREDNVSLQQKIKETNDAIAAARSRLDQAALAKAALWFPAEHDWAQTAYAEALFSRLEEKWDDAINAANRVLTALASIDKEPARVVLEQNRVQEKPQPPPAKPGPSEKIAVNPPTAKPSPPEKTVKNPLPAQYKVRPWKISRDSLRNIAGRPWVYNDPKKWRILYNANKSKMPRPNNPNLIVAGMIIDIPSIKGEFRQGLWDEKLSYPHINE